MLTDIVAQQRKAGLRGIAGATVRARVPLREQFLNDCLQTALSGRPAGEAVTLNRISLRDTNLIVVTVTVRKWLFTQTLNVELTVDPPIIDVPRDPFIRVRLVRAGILGVLAEIFGKLPPYMSLTGSVCTIDLRKALAQFGAAEVFPFLQFIGVTTTSGLLSLEFRLAVPPDLPPVQLP